MLKFGLLEDQRGAIAWLLSQIGLLLAAGILIGAIAGLTFYSDWEKEAAAKNIASHFATSIESVALKEFPGKTKYMFPQKDYPYRVNLSTDYVTVSRGGGMINDQIVAREELLIHPWPDPPMSSGKGAIRVYNYFGENTGSPRQDGSNRQKAVPASAVDREFTSAKTTLASDPLTIDVDKPVYIEKMFIYTEEGTDTSREEYVIVYQR